MTAPNIATPADDTELAATTEEEEVVVEKSKFDAANYIPKPFEILPVTWEIDSTDDIPAPESPYFLLGSEGMYLIKQSMLGKSYLPTKDLPPAIKSVGINVRGVFIYEAEVIPARIMSQAVDFFRMVYKEHKTEAEVLILLNEDQPVGRKYKLFVPAQKVTGGSVHSTYDPADVPKGWYVIGSMHSHCNFSAFHSSIDVGDAATFNGLHITIGYLQRERPEFAVMVSVNGANFNFNANIDVIADITNLNAGRANPAWMNFLFVEKSMGKKIKKKLAEQLETWRKPQGQQQVSGGNNAPGHWREQNKHRPKYPTYGMSGPHGGSTGSYSGSYGSNFKTYEFKKSGTGVRRKYAAELRANFDEGWFNPTGSGHGSELQDDFFADALDLLLEDLAERAESRGYTLDWNITVMEEEDQPKELPEGEDDDDKRSTLLPGAMELLTEGDIREIVSNPEAEDDALIRAPLLN